MEFCCVLALAAPRLFLVVTDGLDLTDISADPVWQHLVGQGSLGLINTRTASRVHAAATHLSIGAAFRADAPTTAMLALEAGEELQGLKAEAAFTALTQQPPAPQGLMVLSLPQLQRQHLLRIRWRSGLAGAPPARDGILRGFGRQLRHTGPQKTPRRTHSHG